MRQKALLVTLSQKLRDNEVIFVDSIEMQAPKAKEAKAFIQGLTKAGFGLGKTRNAALVALPARHTPTIKSFGNFGSVAVEEVRNLNPVSVLSAKYLVIANPKESLDILSKKQVIKSK
jgi:ribosomal protein L4